MNCPVCSKELHEIEVSGVTLDECTTCPGIWFDSGELQRTRREMRLDEQPRKFVAKEGAAPLPCPRCRAKTVETGLVGTAPFHRCAQCGGSFVTDEILPFHKRKQSGSGVVGGLWKAFLRLLELDRMLPTDAELDRARGKKEER